jgi:hypothetical protein
MVAAVGWLFGYYFEGNDSIGVEVFYLSFVNVCIGMFSKVRMFEQVVRLWMVLSSYSCIVASRQVNVAVVATV